MCKLAAPAGVVQLPLRMHACATVQPYVRQHSRAQVHGRHRSVQLLQGGSALAGVAAGLLLNPLCTPCCSVKDICEYVYANDAAVRQFGELRTAEGSQAMIRQLSEAERENRRRFSIAVMQVGSTAQHKGFSTLRGLHTDLRSPILPEGGPVLLCCLNTAHVPDGVAVLATQCPLWKVHASP